MNKSNEKNRKFAAPVVKLHPTADDRDSSETEVRGGSKSIEKVEEFLPIDRNQEKELNRLKALKSELAVKAKESLEKKIISEIASTSTSVVPGKSRNVSPPQSIEPERAREMEIVAQTVAISTKEKQEREDKKKEKISIKPFKINEPPAKGSAESVKPDTKPAEKLEADKGRKSRSRSRSSHR